MILQIKPFIGLSVLFLSVFFSCGQTKKTEGLEVIPIEAAYLHPTTLKASDYFRKIRYVPLETNDHALVGSDPVVWISGMPQPDMFISRQGMAGPSFMTRMGISWVINKIWR